MAALRGVGVCRRGEFQIAVFAGAEALPFVFEERWTGKNRDLELTSAAHTYTAKGRYTVAVKVIDIFGNDTMTLVPVSVG